MKIIFNTLTALMISGSLQAFTVHYDLKDPENAKDKNDEVILEVFTMNALGQEKEHYQWDMNAKKTDLNLPINQTLKDMQKRSFEEGGPGRVLIQASVGEKTKMCETYDVGQNTTKVFFVAADRHKMTVTRSIKDNTLSCELIKPKVSDW